MKRLLCACVALVSACCFAQGTATSAGAIAGSTSSSAGMVRLQLVGPGTIAEAGVTAKNEGTAQAQVNAAAGPTASSSNVTTITPATLTLPLGARGAILGAGSGTSYAAAGAATVTATSGPIPALPIILPLPPILGPLPAP